MQRPQQVARLYEGCGCHPAVPGEELVRDTLPVTADVVDAARQRQRREERAPCIGDVQRGAEVAHRLVVPGARAVEQPESQDDASSAGAREPLSLLLGGERGAQDRQDLADRRVLGRRAVRRVDKRDGGLDVDLRAGCDRRVDEDPRSVRAKPIVLAPRVRIRDLVERRIRVARCRTPSTSRMASATAKWSNRSSSSCSGIASSWPASSATGRNARPSTPVPPVISTRMAPDRKTRRQPMHPSFD